MRVFAFGVALGTLVVAVLQCPICDVPSDEACSNRRAASLDVKSLSSAVEIYLAKNNRLPTRLEDLVPHEIRTIRLDPWRRPYLYEPIGDRFRIRSRGPDGALGTDDDISTDG